MEKKQAIHFSDWSTCTRCVIASHAHRHVFYRGDLPCEILFIGEAPGFSENTTGYPFMGPAGALLDQLMADIRIDHCFHGGPAGSPPTWGVTNTIACLPLDEHNEIRQPDELEILACRPRLREQIDICQPSGFIVLGNIAKAAKEAATEYLIAKGAYDPKKKTGYKPYYLEVPHPAYILRLDRNKLVVYRRVRDKIALFIQRLRDHINEKESQPKVEKKVVRKSNTKKSRR